MAYQRKLQGKNSTHYEIKEGDNWIQTSVRKNFFQLPKVDTVGMNDTMGGLFFLWANGRQLPSVLSVARSQCEPRTASPRP